MRSVNVRSLLWSSALGLVAACGSESADIPNQQEASLGETCADVSCGELGMCVSSADGARCVCSPGVAGEQCEQCSPGFVAGHSPERCVAQISRTHVEPSGENCAHGGVAAETGGDLNGNGKLDPNEVTDSQYTCATDGPVACEGDRCECTDTSCDGHGACTITNRGATCLCDAGYVGGACDTCSDGFVLSRDRSSCIRPATLSADLPEPRGARCPQGGVAHERGLDLDDDGKLASTEVQSIDYVCNTANVRAGDVVVTTQAQLDDLESVTEISGSLSVSATHITSLLPLAKLSRVGGNISIQNTQHLLSTAALASLVEVGGNLTVSANAALGSASFPLLERVNGQLYVSSCPLLTEIQLGQLRTVGGSLTVSGLPQLSKLAGGALYSVAKGLEISNAPVLSDISALDELDAVGETLNIQGTGISSLSALGKLVEVGALFISGNAITTTDGLDSLHAVSGGVTIAANPQLSTVSGFPALYEVSGGLYIGENPSLTSIAAFPLLTSVSGVALAYNAALSRVSGFAELEAINVGSACSWNCGDPSLSFNDLPALEQLDAFASLSTVQNNLSVVGVPALTSLSSVQGLTSVGGGVHIGGTGLTTLPFAKLSRVGGSVSVIDNDALTTLGSLAELQSASGLTVDGNAVLHDLGEWPLLSTLGSLSVSGNPQLASLPAAPAVASLGMLRLVDNVALQGSGLTALTTVSGSASEYTIPDVSGQPLNVYASVLIAGNHALQHLDFLSRLQYTDALLIDGNSLKNLDALSSLVNVGSLDIVGNPALTTMDGVLSAHFESLRVLDNAALESIVFPTATPDAGGALPQLNVITIDDNASLENLNLGQRNVYNLTLSRLAALKTIPALGAPEVNTLHVSSNPALTALDGLAGVAIGSLNLSGNGALEALHGLTPASLSYFTLSGNAALTSLEGFSVASIDTLQISQNAALVSPAGLTAEHIRTLVIEENPALVSLAGLALGSVDDLTLRNNAAITSLEGLALTSLGNFYVQNNSALKSLAGLTVSALYSLRLENNDALETVQGVESLTHIDSLYITGNDALTSLSAYAGGVYYLTITENPRLATCSFRTLWNSVYYRNRYAYGNDDFAVCP